MTEEYIPLATADDVVPVVGRALTPEETQRVDAVLAKASELFRRESGQQFTPGRSQQRLKVDGGEVRLPQRPVTAVHELLDSRGRPVSFTRFKSVLTTPLSASEFVIVDYSHGDEIVPELVRLAIAEIAKTVLTVSKDAAAGLTASTRVRGPFTRQETYATWAIGGTTRLAPEDVALARSFRTRLGGTHVAAGR
ncbi:hypothetical protein [Homoserinibacter sp. GY 40078]|uniref:hypothetical protein n=1 Tax=Homoserinibacter sp. GY 40078 TaxID=2603275 RepID=UPI0011C94508|nr:hypothetical protein [Homoserinibacter sp. GY 40078]TXK17402.1 hypothetical protein FVQ89_11245 [Homoserinibacter sp. GY 40078]